MVSRPEPARRSTTRSRAEISSLLDELGRQAGAAKKCCPSGWRPLGRGARRCAPRTITVKVPSDAESSACRRSPRPAPSGPARTGPVRTARSAQVSGRWRRAPPSCGRRSASPEAPRSHPRHQEEAAGPVCRRGIGDESERHVARRPAHCRITRARAMNGRIRIERLASFGRKSNVERGRVRWLYGRISRPDQQLAARGPRDVDVQIHR